MNKKIFLMLFIGILMLGLTGCKDSGKIIKSIEIEEYQEYLQNKYGKNKSFYVIGEGSGDWFQTGDKTYTFSSSEFSDTFDVNGTISNGEKIFKDTYIEAKYKDRLESYYQNLLDGVLNFDFTIEDSTVSGVYDLDPSISFEDYLNNENLGIDIYLITNTTNLDVDFLKSNVKNVINANKIKNIEKISIAVCNERGARITNYYNIYEQEINDK